VDIGKYQGGTITADLENGSLDITSTSGNIAVASVDVTGSDGTADVIITSAGTITDSTPLMILVLISLQHQ
jgi:hypothetical protein